MITKIANKILRKLGFEVVPYFKFPPDLDREATEIIRAVRPYTMTSIERIFALIEATRYIVRADVPGSIVECGVWRGGSMMAVAHTLKQLGKEDRDLYLFDTYEGMTRPSEIDIDYKGEVAVKTFMQKKRSEESSSWCYASIEEVKRNLYSTGYNHERMRFVKGRVEETIPGSAPERIALLRLDTDWYESTRHELHYLFPRISRGGVLIIDDYGYWQGCRKAVDEYLSQNNVNILLNRIDDTGRIAVKM